MTNLLLLTSGTVCPGTCHLCPFSTVPQETRKETSTGCKTFFREIRAVSL